MFRRRSQGTTGFACVNLGSGLQFPIKRIREAFCRIVVSERILYMLFFLLLLAQSSVPVPTPHSLLFLLVSFRRTIKICPTAPLSSAL